MKCPRCVQRVHRIARQCPHCGFSIADVDQIFGEDDVRLGTLTDAAGVLRKRERLALRRTLRSFESTFPSFSSGSTLALSRNCQVFGSSASGC